MSPLAEITLPPILVLAPVGRDADTIARVLNDMGLRSQACAELGELVSRIDDDTRLLIIAEEGLARHPERLAARLDRQPAWSDLPLLLLSAGGVRRGGEARWGLFERLGNVVLLDRPLHVGALQSAVRSALRARSRQHQARRVLDQLEEARHQLEVRVVERTRQLEAEMAERQQVEGALARSQRLEAIGKLTGGVAHDFNNLLQVIMGGLSILERHGDKPERRAAVLDALRQASERGAKLTQQLLAYARRQRLAPEVLDAAAQIEDMQDLLRGSLRGDMALHLRLAPDIWPVKADATQLEVSVLNLVVNARDAMEDGGSVTISIENASLPADQPIEGLAGDFVRISVRDTGAGMDGETLRRAFEPFFTTKPPGQGTGLGLSQVYGFARQSGGAVHIGSTPGSGTCVCILLPRSKEAIRAPTPGRHGGHRHLGGRILVVEDEGRVAELACDMLRDLGYDCEHAPDAHQALHRDLSGFTAVFSDVIMPGRLDGISLAQELRRRMPDLPILLTTGFVDAPERIIQAGFPTLAKPYTFEQLSAAIGALLREGARDSDAREGGSSG